MTDSNERCDEFFRLLRELRDASTDVSNVPAGNPTFMFVGLSDTWLGQVPLPLTLDSLGLIGCFLYQDLAVSAADTCVPQGPGIARHSLAIPNLPALLNLPVYLQAWATAPAVNPAGLISSNAIALTIGNY